MARPPTAEPGGTSSRAVPRFVLVFAGSLLAFQLLFLTLVVGSAPFDSYLALCARLAGLQLEALGHAVLIWVLTSIRRRDLEAWGQRS